MYPRGKSYTETHSFILTSTTKTGDKFVHALLTEVHVDEISEKEFVTLTCNTSCPEADPHIAFRWYWNKKVLKDCTGQDVTIIRSFPYMSCAVKNNEYLHSDEICKSYLTFKSYFCQMAFWEINHVFFFSGSYSDCSNYVSKRFCMLEGSSVNISSKHSRPTFFQASSAMWYKLKRSMQRDANFTQMVAIGRVEHHSTNENQHTLRINNLTTKDSGEYMFTLDKYEKCEQPDLEGVILVVTGSTIA